MKTFAAVASLILALASPAPAETWTVDKAHSDVGFKVRHLVSNTTGTFRDFDGVFELDREKPTASRVAFTIKTSSIDTAVPDRDKHLRSEDFFDAEKHPEITFRSTKIRPTGKSSYVVEGLLTMRGVTKAVSLPVSFLGFIKDPWGNEKAGFETSVRINRKDFGIVWNKALDAGGALLADEVNVTINLELATKKGA
ncbi:MAG TPA: YceI family protein [Thermoanaerobaculia bacterium]